MSNQPSSPHRPSLNAFTDDSNGSRPTKQATVSQPSYAPSIGAQTIEQTSTPRSERPLPLSSGRAVLHEVMKTFSPDRPWPKLNAAEIAILKQRAEDELNTQRNIDRVRYLRVLSDKKPSATVAFWGLKGDSATTTTCALGADVMSEVTKADVSAIDLNPASGTLGERLGKSNVEVGVNNTVTIRELLYISSRIKNRKHYTKYARPTENGVFVVSADNIVDQDSHLTAADAHTILSVSEDNSSYPYVDTPNDITTPVSQMIATQAGVFVFTAFTGEPDSLRQLGKTMETLRQHGHHEKVDNGVVVISGVPDDTSVDTYRDFLHIVNMENRVVQRLAEFKGYFIGIPFDEAIKPAQKIQLDAIREDTYYAYVDINIAVLEQAPVPNPELPTLLELRKLMEKPSNNRPINTRNYEPTPVAQKGSAS